MPPSSDSPLPAQTGLYRAADLAGFDPARDLGEPGHFPFTRGIRESMYRGRLWTMRQYAGFADAAESNRRYQYLLSQGATGLSIAFDLPTQIGLDSDHPLAQGEVGRVGVPVAHLGDMERLLAGIPLDRISSSMTINATAAILLAYYVAVAKRRGTDLRRLAGTVQNDILKEYIARGTYIYPPAPALRLVTDVFEYAARELPQWNVISISGYHMREAGCTAAQEIAFTLANGMTYVAAARERGLEIDAFAPRLSFFFNAHNNLLEEAAKFRAARRMWARIMKERFQARNERSMMLRFHVQTAGSTLTAQQPLNNVVRTAYQALAAVLGGTQSLHTNSYDEALGLPTEAAARLAVRTQQVLAHESGVAEFIDPLAGSYCVESLTNELERQAEDYLARIDALGGMLRAIEIGFVQKEIENAAYADQRRVESGERIVVGVNRFQADESAATPAQKIEPQREQEQIARLRQWRAARDAARVQNALAAIQETAAGTGNVMPPILAAVEAGATTGEIADALRRQFGEFQETITI
ncbi:MAG TPA: methylmalonyl-CoA mutase family protein [Terriglobales bacterium]|nr:methylmalonyl-CoA mutase family protein [Terriglobales bacterium]